MRKKYKFLVLLKPKNKLLNSKYYEENYFHSDWCNKYLEKFNLKKMENYFYSIQNLTLEKKKILNKKIHKEFYQFKTKWVLYDKADSDTLVKVIASKLTV